MDIFGAPRQGGKTETLVGWLKENPQAILVTHDMREAQRLIREYRLEEKQVRPVNAVTLNTLRGRRLHDFAIDNLDVVLYAIFGSTPLLATITADSHQFMAGAKRGKR